MIAPPSDLGFTQAICYWIFPVYLPPPQSHCQCLVRVLTCVLIYISIYKNIYLKIGVYIRKESRGYSNGDAESLASCRQKSSRFAILLALVLPLLPLPFP